MEYKIVEKPAFTFAGVSKRVPLQYEGVNNAILELAQSITQEQKEEMHRLQNIEPYETVNVSYESDTNFLEEAGALTHFLLKLIRGQFFQMKESSRLLCRIQWQESTPNGL